MLDIHTHILPGVDDGSKNVEQTMKMLQSQTAQGVNTVVLTPHFYASREAPDSFVRRRNKAFKGMLRELCSAENIPELLLGAEVSFFYGMSQFENIDWLCIGNTKTMLIEMPFSKWNQKMIEELKALRDQRRIRPILAHVERYREFHTAGLLDELVQAGIRLQINTSFVLNWQTSRQALGMIKRQEVHFIASDCHGLDYRPPDLGAAMEKIEKRLDPQTMDFLKRNKAWMLGG